MLQQLDTAIIDWIQSGVNTLIVEVNKWLDEIPFVGCCSIKPFCMKNKWQPEKCRMSWDLKRAVDAHYAQCEDEKLRGGLDNLVRAPPDIDESMLC